MFTEKANTVKQKHQKPDSQRDGESGWQIKIRVEIITGELVHPSGGKAAA